MNARDVLLAVAAKEVGTVEIGGANRGPRVEQYLAAVHCPPGNPWCAAFVNWCGAKVPGVTGTPWPLPMVAGCATLYERGKAMGLVREEPAVGAVFLKWFPGLKRFAHTGIVERPSPDVPGAWITIEGNSNPDGGREGYGVFRRARTFAPADRFLYWWPATERPTPEAA